MAKPDMIKDNIENLIEKHLIKKSEKFEQCYEFVI